MRRLLLKRMNEKFIKINPQKGGSEWIGFDQLKFNNIEINRQFCIVWTLDRESVHFFKADI
jgi:hypothetical protein